MPSFFVIIDETLRVGGGRFVDGYDLFLLIDLVRPAGGKVIILNVLSNVIVAMLFRFIA